MELDLSLIAEILTIVLALLSLYLGGKYKKAKQVIKELAEAMDKTYKALEDDKVTKEELKGILKEWSDVLKAGRGLL